MRWTVCCLFAVLWLAAPQTAAHFLLNLNVRIFHVEHRADGVDLLVRTPMPYLVADKVGPDSGQGLPEPAPFTTNRIEQGQLVHYIDWAQVREDALGLGAILATSLSVTANDRVLPIEAVAVRIHRVASEPGFATLEEAQAVFAVPFEATVEESLYAGDAVVDVHLRIPAAEALGQFQIASDLNPDLPDQDQTANVLLNHWPGNSQVFRARGLMTEPIEVSRSRLAAFRTFVVEGIRHILEGLDHVLFVVCLVAGATGLAGLLWRITGFTLGHSITLALGMFGFVPSGAWFVPAIELIIALTILYAAILVFRASSRTSGNLTIFSITGLIGLIHGLGFSFVLQHILKVTSPDIWQSLLAFNIGIEVGQLLLVLVIGAVILIAGKIGPAAERIVRRTLAGFAGAMAAFWTVERSVPLLALI